MLNKKNFLKKFRLYNFWYYKDDLSCQSPPIGLTAGQTKFESVLTLWGILVTTPVLKHTVGTGKQDIDPKHEFRVANSWRALLAWRKENPASGQHFWAGLFYPEAD